MHEHPTPLASSTFLDVFSTSDFMPHGHCYLWKAPLVALHVSSDTLIGTAYVVIALTLWALVRRIRIPFSPMILAFGIFIGACGLTHYMEVWTLWTPDYWLSGLVKLVTAGASVATGAYLVQARPAIGKLAASAQLAEERRIELETQTRELERLYQQVKDLDDARIRFFANLSHELRTPLALMIGTVERLSRSATGDAKRDLEVARRNARVLLRHVNDLLDVARIEEGRMPARYLRTDLAELARGTAAQFEVAAAERRVELAVDVPQRLEAELDPEKIQRVVANLLGNAFKFVPDGGRIRVALRREGSLARLEIEDSGPGVPAALRTQIFERFRQDESGAARTGGTGLGLSIAKEFVELHAGAIGVDDGEWGGARFTVTLPLAAPPASKVAKDEGHRGAASATVRSIADEASAAPAPVALPNAPPAGPGAPHVLVVEDNPEMARFIGEVLGSEFRVSFASDGSEGLSTAEALRPDAVVTDLMMPRAGGDVLLAGLRARPALTTTPVLVLTARDDEQLRARMLREGAQDYVVKPFAAEELSVRVRNLVMIKRSRDVLEQEVAARGRDLEEVARELAQRKRELERAVETTQVAREQAERASKVKSLFLGMTSHELRTPLTSLRLSIQSLASGREPLTPRQREAVSRLDLSARRLLALIETLLEYTRVESGRLTVRPERFDPVALVRDVVDEVLPQAQKKLLSLDVVAPELVSPVDSDPRLVRLVLLNLVVNGLKYTERGGVTVAVGSSGPSTWIEVRDTGPGIPPRDLSRVFEPHEQLGDPGKPAGGVGLGLSLVKGIAEALGAHITVDSEVGRGSVFKVELPERPPERAGPPEPVDGGAEV